jgi:hypothetical protein
VALCGMTWRGLNGWNKDAFILHSSINRRMRRNGGWRMKKRGSIKRCALSLAFRCLTATFKAAPINLLVLPCETNVSKRKEKKRKEKKKRGCLLRRIRALQRGAVSDPQSRKRLIEEITQYFDEENHLVQKVLTSSTSGESALLDAKYSPWPLIELHFLST